MVSTPRQEQARSWAEAVLVYMPTSSQRKPLLVPTNTEDHPLEELNDVAETMKTNSLPCSKVGGLGSSPSQ